ncbi:lysozyme inhibitor LprI family protein [Sphingomonas sp. CFBP 8760]|uniref:lysozyme inhibitor LprI family protein n=1 Tax=Sphingomonas sp. CFBP 8760 TaxID=2775282 RepID=UPI001A910311|nr:lysozyme inhibitor LprI family protein [Sphingomonas sp. CFBP 8760]
MAAGEHSMKLKFLAAAAFLVSAGSPALAQVAPAGISDRYTACASRAGTNTVQQGICAQSEIAAQDARLNKAYQQVMRQLAKTPDKRLALRTAQRSWLKARDYECKIDQETINSTCLVMKTATRANELESMVRF